MIRRTHIKRRLAAVAVLLATAGSAWADTQGDVTAQFHRFIAAQNAHDLKTVGEILLDAPTVLWVARGGAVEGHEAILSRFEALDRGTWRLEPRFDEAAVTTLAPDVAQLLVPATITVAAAGEPGVPRRFLLTQMYVRRESGWKLATILTLPAP